MNYQILKYPWRKDVYDHLYFRRHEKKSTDHISDIDSSTTLYVCNFSEALDIGFIKKYFGVAGQIQTVKLGEFRNKTSNKKKWRIIHFALVIYVSSESVEKALEEGFL